MRAIDGTYLNMERLERTCVGELTVCIKKLLQKKMYVHHFG